MFTLSGNAKNKKALLRLLQIAPLIATQNIIENIYNLKYS